jgi:hypothetical protein
MHAKRLGLRDLLRPNTPLDRDRLGRQRVGLGDTDQRLGEPQPDQRDGLLAQTDVHPNVKRLGQQRL